MCIFLSGMLVFNGGYKSYVDAFSLAVIGTVTLGEAILYCAATLGTVWAASEVYENADTLAFAGEQMLTDFQEWCLDCSEYIDVTSRDIEDWLGKVVEGTLDKGCEVWDAFKDYIASINVTQGEIDIYNNSGGTQYADVSYNEFLNVINKIDRTSLKNAVVNQSMNILLERVENSDFFATNNGHTVSVSVQYEDYSTIFFVSNKYRSEPNLIGAYGYGIRSRWVDKVNSASDYGSVVYINDLVDFCPGFGGCWSSTSLKDGESCDYSISIDATWQEMKNIYGRLHDSGYLWSSLILASGVINGYWDFSIPIPDWGIADDVIIDDSVKEVLERDGTLDNVDVWGYGDMTLDKDDVLTIPWENVQPTDLSEPFVGGQTVAIDLVDGVTVDTDIPVEDIPVEPVVPRDSYTIANLETVFPFCVPFDLVKIFTLFNAEPEAPHFTWKFYFWVGEMKTYDVEIDLSPFDSVAEILRLMELIGFMVFLTLKTRDLIRG